MAQVKQRARQLPGRHLGAEALIDVTDQQLKIQWDAAEAGVARVAEVIAPAQLVGDDRRVRQVGVEDRAALKTVRQRVADGDQPVPRSPALIDIHLDVKVTGRHRHAGSRAYFHGVRDRFARMRHTRLRVSPRDGYTVKYCPSP